MPAGAAAQADVGYTRCDNVGAASVVQVAGTTCESVTGLVENLLAETPDRATAVLAAAGWTPQRALVADTAGQYDLIALNGLRTLRIRRPGTAPDLDGWAAGRELLFARKLLVGGKPPPNGTVVCTSAFLVRLPSGRLGGLSAAHCGGLRKDRTVQRRNTALRRPPAPGIVLGRVLRIVTRTARYDALVLRVPTGANRPASAVVDRGIGRPPWRVLGAADPRSGRRVCLTGRTSGVDRCGNILGATAHRGERLISKWAGVRLRCTSIPAARGDSGGPVYTAPGAKGTVYAIGITSVIVPLAANRMCFTPIKPVLRTLRATIVPAPT